MHAVQYHVRNTCLQQYVPTKIELAALGIADKRREPLNLTTVNLVPGTSTTVFLKLEFEIEEPQWVWYSLL